MAQIVNFRCVLAVRNLEVSTRYYVDTRGFQRDPIHADGWSFLTRDNFLRESFVESAFKASWYSSVRLSYAGRGAFFRDL